MLVLLLFASFCLASLDVVERDVLNEFIVGDSLEMIEKLSRTSVSLRAMLGDRRSQLWNKWLVDACGASVEALLDPSTSMFASGHSPAAALPTNGPRDVRKLQAYKCEDALNSFANSFSPVSFYFFDRIAQCAVLPLTVASVDKDAAAAIHATINATLRRYSSFSNDSGFKVRLLPTPKRPDDTISDLLIGAQPKRLELSFFSDRITEISGLEELRLIDFEIRTEELDFTLLAHLAQLKSLKLKPKDVQGYQWPKAALETIRSMDNLDSIGLPGSILAQVILYLPRVKSITVYGPSRDFLSIFKHHNRGNLNSLSLVLTSGDECFALSRVLENHASSIESLDLYFLHSWDECRTQVLVAASKLEKLKDLKISLHRDHLHHFDFSLVTSLVHLKSFEFIGVINDPSHDSLLEYIKATAGLEKLSLTIDHPFLSDLVDAILENKSIRSLWINSRLTDRMLDDFSPESACLYFWDSLKPFVDADRRLRVNGYTINMIQNIINNPKSCTRMNMLRLTNKGTVPIGRGW